MDTGPPDQTLDSEAGVDDLLHVGILGVQLADLAALVVAGMLLVVQVRQRHAFAHHVGRHRLDDPLPHRERVAQDPAGVFHGRLGLNRGEGVDLGGVLLPVLIGDVTHHLVALAIVEVQVDVGRVDPFRVQETFEQQPMLERVEFGDPGQVGHHRAGGRASPRADRDVVLAGVAADVGDDQEVRGEAHRLDHPQLGLDPLGNLRGWVVAVAQPDSPVEFLA